MEKEGSSSKDIEEAMNPGGAERKKALEKLRTDCPDLNEALAKIEDGIQSQEELMQIIDNFNKNQQQNRSGMYNEYPIVLDDPRFHLSISHFKNGTIEMKGEWDGQ